MNTFISIISDKPPNNPCEVVRNNPHYMGVVTGAQKGEVTYFKLNNC